MMLFRLVFVVLSGLAIAGTTYVAYLGHGGESRDLDRSIRAVSAGRGLNGSIK
ncbi:hypothetical protein [Pseudophaeobacter sp.]|jgi:hypothetical protein|uniref:Uncharacterized protein n=2 Tax=Pseudophaeobacter TaxID=1541822 RepID=A0ABQ0ALW2_9RHOB|nr:hypothetical protein [Pseudophaeobacter sp.]UWS79053.1 hypothetical protein N1037_17595 [Phaeobacter sp. G2]